MNMKYAKESREDIKRICLNEPGFKSSVSVQHFDEMTGTPYERISVKLEYPTCVQDRPREIEIYGFESVKEAQAFAEEINATPLVSKNVRCIIHALSMLQSHMHTLHENAMGANLELQALKRRINWQLVSVAALVASVCLILFKLL